MTLGNGTTRKYAFDNRGQITTQVELDATSAPVVTLVDSYDAVGNRLTRSVNGTISTWTHDDLYRLTGQLKPGQAATYTLDGAGNLRTMWEGGSFPKTFTFNAADRLVTMVEGANLTTYSHTGYGALASEITGTSTTTYSYSGQDHLIGVIDSSAIRSTYTFDGDGLRRTAQNGNVQATTMVWDGSDYLLLKGPASDQVVLTAEGEILSVGTYDLLPDPLGSVIGYTQAGSNPTTPFSYWPYGRSSSPGFRPPFPYLYVGSLGYYQDSPDRDYVRARELYKSIGRWMQVDPLWPALEPYGYTNASPIILTDRYGKSPSKHPCDVRTDKYCEDAKRFGGRSRALNCFCRVSALICDLFIKRGIPGKDNPGAAFLDCLNRCMFNEYRDKTSSLWKSAIKRCRHQGYASRACCIAMVHAEQDALDRCFSRCRRIPEAGEPPWWWWYCDPENNLFRSIPSYLPGFPFASDTITRTHAAIYYCCDGEFGDPVT